MWEVLPYMQLMKRWSRISTKSSGFTLIEAIISLTILTVVMGVIVYTYLAATRLLSSEFEDSDVTYQMNKAMDRMSGELRSARQITSASSTSITFWYNDNNNNNTREATETASYSWTGGTVEAIFRTVVASTERIANNISNLTLSYDNVLDIGRITISITGHKNSTVSTIESSVNCRNL
jgi:type II secretory pathway pseudopilin PulG